MITERRIQTNITLSNEQLEYIKENMHILSRIEIAKRFKCSTGKIYENCRLAGIEFPQRNQHGIKKGVVRSDIYFEHENLATI